MHMKVGKRHPVAANRTIAVVSAMFAFAEKRGLLPAGHVNPARGIDKFPETGRERFLTTEELERLGSAIREAETVGVPWDVDETKPTAKHIPKRDRQTVIWPFAGAAIRLLLFTGCRLREILDLRWTEVDFERGMLHLPDSKTGKKTSSSTPRLSPSSPPCPASASLSSSANPVPSSLGPETTVGPCDAARGPCGASPSRPSPCLCQRRRRGLIRPANRRQALGTQVDRVNSKIRAFRRRSSPACLERDRRDHRRGLGRAAGGDMVPIRGGGR